MQTVGLQKHENASRSLKGSLLRYIPLLVWLALISYASTGDFSAETTSRFVGPLLRWLFPKMSAQNMELAQMLVRKCAHFGLYAVLGVLAARAFSTSSLRWLRRRWFTWSAVLIVAYAVIDEYHQSFVTSRTGSPIDSLIDIVGGLFALVAYRFLRFGDTRANPSQ